MKKKIILTFISALFSGLMCAQEVVVQTADSVLSDSVNMPVGMLISEDELASDFTNRTNLTPAAESGRQLSYNDSVIVSRLTRIPTTIEMPLNDVTRKYIEKYSEKMKGSVAIMLGASNFYNPIFEEALERHGLPLELRYLPVIESALKPTATSRVGAAGLWQFMIATGKRYGLEINTLVDERRDPIKSSDAAARYLSDLYNMFGDWGLAIAAYNCGEGNVQKALARNGNQEGADFWSIYNRLPHETRGYVPAFIAATYIMNYYCEHGITPYDATLPDEADTIKVQKEIHFSKIASKCNVSMEQLRALNPQYRRDIVPVGYSLCMPKESVLAFAENEDSIYGNIAVGADLSSERRGVTDNVETAAAESKNAGRSSRNSRSSRSSSRNSRSRGGKSVTVRSGDTLSQIAQRNGTTVAKLRRMNGIRGNMIRPGQKLRVK